MFFLIILKSINLIRFQTVNETGKYTEIHERCFLPYWETEAKNMHEEGKDITKMLSKKTTSIVTQLIGKLHA